MISFVLACSLLLSAYALLLNARRQEEQEQLALAMEALQREFRSLHSLMVEINAALDAESQMFAVLHSAPAHPLAQKKG